MQEKVSVFIITLNEEAHIAETINSVSSFDEVIVVDSGSTDDTIEIAKNLGAKVVHHDWQGYAKQKHYAMGLCQNEWCFNIDGDEILSPEGLEEITSIIDNDQADAIRLPICDLFMSTPLPKRVKKRSIVRVFKKSKVEYPLYRHVHENVIVNGREIKAKIALSHWGYNGVELLMAKQNQYSSLRALDKIQGNKKPSLIKLFLLFPLMFIKSFFFRGLWRAGVKGLIYAMIDCMYAFLKEAKLYEHTYLKKKQK